MSKKCKLYGLNWIGSKGLFADQIIDILPAADTFIDLFCGGCAVSHAALVSGKYKHVIANDIKDMGAFFKQAIEGKVENLLEPISREEFFARNKTDPKVMSCWSFSGNLHSYIWGKEEGAFNLELFKAIADPDWVKRKEHLRAAFVELMKIYDAGKLTRKTIVYVQKVKTLNGLKRVADLAKWSHLAPMLEPSRKDYRDVVIPQGACVYADIPYINCQDYGTDFKHEEFYKWWDAQPFPVFVSEYEAPEGFSEIWQTVRRVTLGNLKYKQAVEKLFVQERFADRFRKREVQPQPELLEATA